MSKVKNTPSLTKSDTNLLIGFGLIRIEEMGEVYLTDKSEHYKGIFSDIINLAKKKNLKIVPFNDNFNIFLPSERGNK